MNKKYFVYSLIIGWIGLISFTSCKKFLEEKTVKSYTVPSKISDLQALLDYTPTMAENDLASAEVCSDDYYLTDATWSALSSEYLRRLYYWEKTNVFATGTNEWANAYKTIYVANEVLSDLKKMSSIGQEDNWNGIFGQANFYRGKMFLQVVSLWGNAYHKDTAIDLMGIPLRLKPDFNEASVRSNLQESYNQIIKDFKAAAQFLPRTTISPYRPSKAAAYGYLARVYLNMRDYQQAGLYADSCLQIKNTLLDYNAVVTTASFPFAKLNTEVVSESFAGTPSPLSPSRAKVVDELYNLYDLNDLRKLAFFKTNVDQTHSFKGSYEGNAALFTGVAVDEMVLVRAECSARLGKLEDAISDLNRLLVKRYKTGSFVPLVANTQAQALGLVLKERRKELLFRGLRWMDLKRLNMEGAEITITRTLNGITYVLLPNESKWALPIPDDVIRLSGMQQNP